MAFIPNTTRQQTAAVKSPDFNPTGQTETFTVNVSAPQRSWRLVHDGKKVIALFESVGFTETRNTLVCFDTREECEAECARLGLEVPPPC